MAKYNNNRADSALASVEFSSGQDGNFAFFHVHDAAKIEKIKGLLAYTGSSPVVAQSEQDGQSILVVKTSDTPDHVLASLSKAGENFTPEVAKKEFQGWKWRGGLSLAGQSLDIASVYLARKNHTRSKGDNTAYMLFAVFNVAASIVNMTFGAKKIPDAHRMRFLKSQVNEAVQPYVAEGDTLPSPDSISKPDETPKTGWGKTHEFIRGHSVYIDMALRTFGNMNLITPVNKWREKGWRNKLNDNLFTRRAGISLMIGKAITLFSKVPDPYNPEPPSALDTFREKVTFRLGNSIESLSAVFMGYNSFAGTKNKEGVRKNNPTSGFANVLFMGGYGARFFAPFGVRETDLSEIETHVAECLAKVPKDQLPNLIAKVSAELKSDLKDQPVQYGEIYTHILDNLAKYHQVTINASEEKPTPIFTSEKLKTQPVSASLRHADLAEKSAGVGLGV